MCVYRPIPMCLYVSVYESHICECVYVCVCVWVGVYVHLCIGYNDAR